MKISDDKIMAIINLFCTWSPNDGGCDVWGMDTCLFDTLNDAKKAVREIIEKEVKND